MIETLLQQCQRQLSESISLGNFARIIAPANIPAERFDAIAAKSEELRVVLTAAQALNEELAQMVGALL